MNKIKKGKTILLNKVTNTTFVANKLDEEVQTGNRAIDVNIEWTGELDIEVCEITYKHIAEALWQQIDDIDTLTDMLKPRCEKSYKAFYDAVQKGIKKRFLYMKSDGQNLEINHPIPSKEECYKTGEECNHNCIGQCKESM